MATIEKRERQKGSVYQVDIRIAGYPRQKKTFKRLTDARAWAAKTENEIKSGQFRPLNRNSQRKTFSDILDRYEHEVLPHLAESTQRASQTYLKHWRDVLGEFSLSFITSEQITKAMQNLARSSDGRSNDGLTKPKSRKTQKHYRDTLEVLFKKAVTWGWLGTNPMDGVEQITKIRNERVRYLSDAERDRLLDACRTSPNQQLYPIVIFALATGARKGEILGLTISDVDLDRKIAVFRDTKNGDTRSAPLVGHLHDLLSDQMGYARESYAGVLDRNAPRYLFPRRDLRAAIDIRKAWENALKAAEVEDFRFHDLRHCAASYLAMQGATMLEIADMLGHRTLQMVKRYSHLSADHKRGLAEKLNSEMFETKT